MDNKELLSAEEWISVKKEMPTEGSKVRYRMIKRTGMFKKEIVEDVGFFSKGEFTTIDPRAILPITHWKYLNNQS